MTTAEYMARACMCGAPRSHHAYSYIADHAGRVVMRIMSVVNDKCVGFIDAIECQIGYPAGIDQGGYPVEIDVDGAVDSTKADPTKAEPGGN